MANPITQSDLDALAYESLLDLADSAGFDVEQFRGQPEKPNVRAKIIKLVLAENVDRSMLPRDDKRPRPDDEEDEDASEAKRPRTEEPEEEEPDEEEEIQEEEEIEGVGDAIEVEEDLPYLDDILMMSRTDAIAFLQTKNIHLRKAATMPQICRVLAEKPNAWRLRPGDTKPTMFLDYVIKGEQKGKRPIKYATFVAYVSKNGSMPPPIPRPEVDVDEAMEEAKAEGLTVPDAMTAATRLDEEAAAEAENAEEEDEEIVEVEVVDQLVEPSGADEFDDGALLGESDIADVLKFIQEKETDEDLRGLSNAQRKILQCLGLME